MLPPPAEHIEGMAHNRSNQGACDFNRGTRHPREKLVIESTPQHKMLFYQQKHIFDNKFIVILQ